MQHKLSGTSKTHFREYLAHRVRTALIQVGEQEASQGQPTEAAQPAERAYLLRGAPEPDPEDFQRLYTLLQAGGSPIAAEVKREAESFCIPLTIDLEEQEPAEQATTEETSAQHNLPTRSTSFVGRDPELLEIAKLLSNSECRLLTVHGPGGVGKSRLALQVAREQLQEGAFKDGVFFVALDALTNPELIPGSIAEALGIDLQGKEDPLTRVMEYLAGKSLLLILDNFEQLVESATTPANLLAGSPNLKILITSRERLNVEEEWVLTLEGLPLPGEPVRVEDSHHYEAVQLFLERAKRARLDFFLTQETLPHVVEICRLVGGSPLGIELAAVWIKVMSALEIREEIARNLAFLETTTRNIPKRHRSIEAAFEYSWQLLSTREQEVFRKLSVFTGGFRKEAASSVVGATLSVLVSLVDKSLLSASPTGRYERHPLLYQFAREKLAEHPGEHTEFQERHARYYLELIQERYQDLGTPRHKETLAVFEEELSNIRTAWRWLVEGVRSSEIRQYATAFSELYQNHTQEAAEVFAETAAVLDETIPEQQAALGYVLIERSEYLYFLTRFDEAIELAQRGLGLLRPLGEVLGILRGLLSTSHGYL